MSFQDKHGRPFPPGSPHSSWCFGKEGSPEPDESPGRASPPSSCPHPCSHVQSSRLGRWLLRDEALGLWDSSVTGQGGHGLSAGKGEVCLQHTAERCVGAPSAQLTCCCTAGEALDRGRGASDVLPEPERGGGQSAVLNKGHAKARTCSALPSMCLPWLVLSHSAGA